MSQSDDVFMQLGNNKPEKYIYKFQKIDKSTNETPFNFFGDDEEDILRHVVETLLPLGVKVGATRRIPTEDISFTDLSCMCID